MADVVYQFTRKGDHEPEAREILQSFVGREGFSGSHVHNASGLVTIALVDDPSPELVKAFEQKGWTTGSIWNRA